MRTNKTISLNELNTLAVKEMKHFKKQRRPNGVVSLKCLMFDVDNYLTNQSKHRAK